MAEKTPDLSRAKGERVGGREQIRANHVGQVARESGLDPALLASKRELEALLRNHGNGDETPERFLGWRRELITRGLQAVSAPARQTGGSPGN